MKRITKTTIKTQISKEQARILETREALIKKEKYLSRMQEEVEANEYHLEVLLASLWSKEGEKDLLFVSTGRSVKYAVLLAKTEFKFLNSRSDVQADVVIHAVTVSGRKQKVFSGPLVEFHRIYGE